MADEMEQTVDATEVGSVRIANDVVATIAGLAATDIAGVAGMSGGVVGGIAEMLGRKNLTKGVKVELGDNNDAAIDIYIIVEFGSAIPQVAAAVQATVKNTVESMTGLTATAVNIFVQGVTFPQGFPNNTNVTE